MLKYKLQKSGGLLSLYFCFFSNDHPIKIEFYSELRESYEKGAQYIQKKFPLQNEILKLLSSIDPKCHGNTVAADMMKRLSTYFPNVVSPSDKDSYDLEVDGFHLQQGLPVAVNSDGSMKRLDQWWSEVFATIESPHMFGIIKAALSIFTGPMIEQSFR